MSILDSVTTHEEYAAVAWLFRESATRGMGWATEQLYQNDSGVTVPADLRHFGNLIEEIARSGANEERQGKHLNRLGVGAANYFGVRGSNDKHPMRPLVEAIFELGNRREHRRQGYHDAATREAEAFCAVIDIATLALAKGVTPGAIAENPQALAGLVHRYSTDIGRPVSVGHAEAILRSFARWGSVYDWISPGAVERLRERLRHKPPTARKARILN